MHYIRNRMPFWTQSLCSTGVVEYLQKAGQAVALCCPETGHPVHPLFALSASDSTVRVGGEATRYKSVYFVLRYKLGYEIMTRQCRERQRERETPLSLSSPHSPSGAGCSPSWLLPLHPEALPLSPHRTSSLRSPSPWRPPTSGHPSPPGGHSAPITAKRTGNCQHWNSQGR